MKRKTSLKLLKKDFTNAILSKLLRNIWSATYQIQAFLSKIRNLKNYATSTSLIGITLCLLFYSCANIVQPTGGARDETPPKLLQEGTTENYQTNFNKRTFKLSYNEWIQLKDEINQVIVSPPLQYRPDIRLKKKSVIFEFNEQEELREDATYVINFGDAIQDYTEGNEAEMIFVFSTGDYIDSLEISGNIVDAFTGEPEPDVLLMLYDNLADSVLRKERPFYFGKTDEKGAFEIKNIKSDTFKVVALKDSNLNYLYDSEAEEISFLDTLIFLNDSSNLNLTLRLFQEDKKLKLRVNEQDDYGRVNLVFNQTPQEPNIFYDDFGQFAFWETEKDSVRFWYDVAEERDWNIYFQRDTLIDTVKVDRLSKEEWKKKAKLKLKSFNQTAFDYTKNLELEFNYPLRRLDTAAIFVLQDTIADRIFPLISIDSINQKQLNFAHNWQQTTDYEIIFTPDALTDAFGWQNADTLRQTQKTASEKDFGVMMLKFENLARDTAYIAKLFDSSEDLIQEFIIQDTTDFSMSIGQLLPGKYAIQLIEDVDKNGQWTTGNYDEKRFPERIFKQELEEIRAQWDVEATVSGDAFR